MVRKSREGKLLIIAEKNDMDMIKKIQERIKETEGTVNAKISEPRRDRGIPIHVKDIDGIMKKEEVIQAIQMEVGKEGLITTGELRPYFAGNQALTAVLKREAAELLIKKGKIRVGLNICSVQEKVEVPKCYRCWSYKHLSKDCKGEADLSKACRKCGALDHLAKECQNEVFCISCKTAGHPAGGRNCPEFKVALKKAKQKAKTRWEAPTHRRKAAHDLLAAVCAIESIDIIIVCEPNENLLKKKGGWYADEQRDVCIITRRETVKVLGWGRGRGYVWIRTQEGTIYGVYISPNTEHEAFENILNNLENDIKDKGTKVALAGDFNAKSPWWGEGREDRRGATLVEWMGGNDMIIINEGNMPTFEREGSTSILDLTMATGNWAEKFKKWKVREEETLSLHKYIYFEIDDHKKKAVKKEKRKIDKEKCRQVLREGTRLDMGRIDLKICIDTLKGIKREITQRNGEVPRGNSVYWWTPEVAEERRRTIVARRELSRIRRRTQQRENDVEQKEREYKERRKSLKKLIMEQKKKCWEETLREVQNDPWGQGYKIVMKALGKEEPVVHLEETRKRNIIKELFPRAMEERLEDITEETEGEITREELEEAGKRIKEKKAPGPDGIPPEMVKILLEEKPEIMLQLMNTFYGQARFPDEWKQARLTLIHKPGKNQQVASSYRPICLLNVLGKVYESILTQKLQRELDRVGGLSDTQFGFRKGKTTIDAVELVVRTLERSSRVGWCALILVDVQNAFNSASLRNIQESLRRLGIDKHLVKTIDSYMKGRSISWNREELKVDRGVPQGAVLGPTLWNVSYNGVLRIPTEEGVKMVAYADDLAIIVEEQRMEKLNKTLRNVAKWMREHSLKLAPAKTEAIAMWGMKRARNIEFKLEGHRITPQKEVKYLGVIIDRGLIFGSHVEYACQKAEKSASALTRLMPNIGGAHMAKRKLLAEVVHSTVLYAAPTWAKAVVMRKYKEKLIGCQRKMAMRIISAYRTVSTEAALVIAGTIPMDLMVEERRSIYTAEGDKTEAMKEQRETTIRRWQVRWEGSTKGRWTWRLINDIKSWLNRKQGEVDYYITQALTGHGSFLSYLKKIGKTNDDACPECREPDTAYHTLFECERWLRERYQMRLEIGEEITAENLISKSCENQRNWEIIMGGVGRIMRRKEEELRNYGRA
ncbi:hypothetical protein NQ315_012824 [Exocentrus adspersus]|uniref:Reverse transcriptase domain-containing protein n=1 Tax=Exocentrus adspersus TaxID=1586481 RepID=A0AAV8V8G9_9CUCU|nr:hypothetical protein NQ315_012824 [Exocentrus adspersus]